MATFGSMCVGGNFRLQRLISFKRSLSLKFEFMNAASQQCHYSRSLLCSKQLLYAKSGWRSVTSRPTTIRIRQMTMPVVMASEDKLHHLPNRLFYSTQQSGATGLTNEILKSKLSDNRTDKKGSGDEQSSKSGGNKSHKESLFSGKNAWKLGLISLGGMGVVVCGNLLFVWGAPSLDKEGNEIIDEFSELPKWEAYPKRAWKEFHFFKQMIRDPSSEKLLPDPLKEPYFQPPYTLVLEMTGILVHPDWTLGTGWRFKKRPMVDYFLQQIGPPLFEVVIYTAEQGFTAFPIIDGLDPNGYIMYRLFRDATRYTDGHHVKDLSCLNRDLSKVIIVDCNHNSFKLQPRNGVLLKKWKGNDDDRTLVDLAAFLRTIAMSGVEDVRGVLDHYNHFDDPLEAFKENQRRLQVEQEKQSRVAQEQKEKQLTKGWSSGFLGRRR